MCTHTCMYSTYIHTCMYIFLSEWKVLSTCSIYLFVQRQTTHQDSKTFAESVELESRHVLFQFIETIVVLV